MMSWQPVILWTDGLIWLTAGVLAILLWRGVSNFRTGWHLLLRKPVAVATGLILLCYVGIGLLDSLHFRARLPVQAGQPMQYSVEINSVLDVLLAPLRAYPEQTYSAPLASLSFVPSPVSSSHGRLEMAYMDLHIHATTAPALFTQLVRGALLGGVLAVLLSAGIALGYCRHAMLAPRELWRAAWRGEHAIPWRTLWLTLTLLCVFAAELVALSGHWHVLGTDKVGQDVLYVSLKSVRTGLMFGTLATLVTLPLAVGLGIAAGYLGSWVDDVIQYVYITLNSIPGVLLIAAAVLLMQVYIEAHPALFDSAAARADYRLLFLCLILGMTSWTGLCRVLRGETLKLRELEYVQAARVLGVSDFRIMLRHILPNLSHLILISVVMDFSGFVLAEAVLSYLGLGVDPSMDSWGNMINAAQLELSREPVVWWQLASAFGWMFALVLSANLFAEALREAFDPLWRRT